MLKKHDQCACKERNLPESLPLRSLLSPGVGERGQQGEFNYDFQGKRRCGDVCILHQGGIKSEKQADQERQVQTLKHKTLRGREREAHRGSQEGK